MITVGIDLASQDDATASCRVEWIGGEARVSPPRCPQTDEDLIAAVEAADFAGIDIPFGWPDAFVQALTTYQVGGEWPDARPAEFCYRVTDHHVMQRLKERGISRRPLSVASDRIAIPAMRAARLLTRVAARGKAVDRTSASWLIEAYPAAALAIWGLPSSRYKGKEFAKERQQLFEALQEKTHAWLRLDALGCSTCCASDHALDSLVAALIARAAALGLCEPPPPEHAAVAAREGWIALPTPDALDRLAKP